MAERHDSATEQGCFEASREVGEWVGGGGSKRWQSGGRSKGAVQCRFRCRLSTVEAGAADRRVWELELELGWDRRQNSRAARGPRQGGMGDGWGGPSVASKVEGDAVQLHNVVAPKKKAMRWDGEADGRRSPN